MDTGLSLEGFTYPQTSIQLAIAHQRFAALAMVRELFGEMMKMNRELLFRGFHPCDGPETIVVDGEKVKGRWVEGSLLNEGGGGTKKKTAPLGGGIYEALDGDV